MSNQHRTATPVEAALLAAIALLFGGVSMLGIGWGLPGRAIDRCLFGDTPPWPGEKIHRLAGADQKFSPSRGADVDADPLDGSADEPVLLTATDEDVAKIYLRYRLYTYQPDEMITMMALAGMKPKRFDFDPRLYQYGGLYIYPVGTLLGLCDAAGLIDVRSDVAFYLDNPDEFGKFYVVARAYSAAWGVAGVFAVFAIGRRLGGSRGGLLAALLYTLMPVTVCMAHEGKPHLPGAVLMLLAVLLAMRHLSTRAAGNRAGEDRAAAQSPRGTCNWWLMCGCCGAALGMVLSSWPIFVLIPLVVLLDRRRRATGGTVERSVAVDESEAPRGLGAAARLEREGPRGPKPAALENRYAEFGFAAKRTAIGIALAVGVYLIANPYILINALTNREVLRSNFANSLAMYEIARVGEGFLRVLELTVEGATLPILALGVVALAAAAVRRNGTVIPLAVPAAIFFLQFVLIGAGKPAEYGRFGIFTNTALAVGAACLLCRRWAGLHGAVNWIAALPVMGFVGWAGAEYLANFHIDCTDQASRLRACRYFRSSYETSGDEPALAGLKVAVVAEPAPYCCPPLPFAELDVVLLPTYERATDYCATEPDSCVVVRAVDLPGPLPQGSRSEASARAPGVTQHSRRLPDRFNRTQTPISWANKPVELVELTATKGSYVP